jgi:AraC family transcriptional regulator
MFNIINENNFSNLRLPRESSLVNFSSFKELKTDSLLRSFCIKLVLEGTEKYTINGRDYLLKGGEFLLANHHSRSQLTIGNSSPVKGICIDIAPSLISQVIAGYQYDSILEQDDNIDKYFTTEQFLENKYSINQSTFGSKLKSISSYVTNNTTQDIAFHDDFFYELAENLVTSFSHQSGQQSQIKANKISTKKELYRRLLDCKNYLDEHYAEDLNILSISSQCYMSEYHFYRLFKQAFNISPHQYLTTVRMNKARNLIQDKGLSISEVALLSGYRELSTFSKIFKKSWGVAPSKVLT